MDLKNAAAVCLISLCSATIVVLIARWLDCQAAAQLQPQLAAIAEELRSIRKQGGIAASPAETSKAEMVDDGLVVYYFHGNTRCPTCEAIESQAKETLKSNFGPQMDKGEIAWKVVNYEKPSSKSLAVKFEIQMPVVVLARMKGGEVADWKRLDEVWAIVGDKPAFAKLVQGEIERMLAAKQPPTSADDVKPPTDIPIP